MRVRVTFIIDETVDNEEFHCDSASRTMRERSTSIKFVNGRDAKGNKVAAVLYRQAVRVITYED